jgi:hypothetical protein
MQPTEQICTNSTPSKNGLSPNQAQVLQLIAEGLSISDAARQAGVSRSTVYYWTRTHPDFYSAIKASRQRAVDSVLDEVHALAASAPPPSSSAPCKPKSPCSPPASATTSPFPTSSTTFTPKSSSASKRPSPHRLSNDQLSDCSSALACGTL